MIAAGVGFVAKTLTYVLAPSYSSDLMLAPMFVNALAVAIWMSVRGVNQDKFARKPSALPSVGAATPA